MFNVVFFNTLLFIILTLIAQYKGNDFEKLGYILISSIYIVGLAILQKLDEKKFKRDDI